MHIIITNEKNLSCNLLVLADIANAINERKTVIIERINNSSGLKTEVKYWIDNGQDEEGTLRQACQEVIEYAQQHGYNNIVFDTQSFTDDSTDLSYVANILTEELSTIADRDILNDMHINILFPSVDESETYITEFEEELSKPIIETKNQSYGDYGDPLKEQFKQFQKSLGEEKTFREYLVDIIDRKGFRKASEVYKAAGVSKYTFSRLTNFSINPPHKPSKSTVAALTIGLKLTLAEAEEFYEVADTHLGKTEFIDKVIRFFIDKKIYNIDEVNYCLAYHGQPLLGERMRGDNPKIIIR